MKEDTGQKEDGVLSTNQTHGLDSQAGNLTPSGSTVIQLLSHKNTS